MQFFAIGILIYPLIIFKFYQKQTKIFVGFIAILSQIFIFIFISLGMNAGWNYLKSDARSKLVDQSSILDSTDLVLNIDIESFKYPEFMIRNVFSLVRLSPSSLEVERMTRNAFENGNCGVIYPTTEAYIADIVTKNLVISCKSVAFQNFFTRLISVGLKIYSLNSVVYLVILFLFIFQRNWKVVIISLPPLILIFEYAILGLWIDRYGAPLYLYSTFMFLFYLQNLRWYRFKTFCEIFVHRINKFFHLCFKNFRENIRQK
jgi:hypothetical protein